MGPEIYKVESIGNGSLSVMAKPVSGEWIEEEFSGIAKFGINKIVSLLESQEARDLGLKDERLIAEKHGMAFFNFSIQDRGLPENSMSNFLALTKNLYQEITDGINVVVHCRAGIGRTGIVAAGILLHCGFTPDRAIQKISDKRGIKIPDTQKQIEWIHTCYQSLKEETQKR